MLTLSGAVGVLWGAGFAGCGSTSDNGDGGEDAKSQQEGGQEAGHEAGGDVATEAPAATTFQYIVIYDKETIDCNATSGPGADIDAVELKSGGSTVGFGLIGSGLFGVGSNPCDQCKGKACTHSCSKDGKGADCPLAANVEGPRDAKIYKSMPDTGYISLNSGSIQVQFGDRDGNGPAKDFKPGDTVKVWEIDQVYAGDSNYDVDGVCICEPERYEVFAYTTAGLSDRSCADNKTCVQLNPGKVASQNADMCAAMKPTDTEGCGTTEFSVPTP